MKNDDNFESFLRTMTHERGLGVAYTKAKVAEKQLYLDEEEALEVFMKFVNADPALKKSYMNYEEATSAVSAVEIHYSYLQGLSDGIKLTHVV